MQSNALPVVPIETMPISPVMPTDHVPFSCLVHRGQYCLSCYCMPTEALLDLAAPPVMATEADAEAFILPVSATEASSKAPAFPVAAMDAVLANCQV